MFERFTEGAIKAIMLAQEEARRLGHNFVGTEMILLGIIGEGQSGAARLLNSHDVNLSSARIEVEKIIGRGQGFVAIEIPFTPRAKRALESSWEAARAAGHNFIGVEHLLKGTIDLINANSVEEKPTAGRVMEALGVNISELDAAMGDVLKEMPSSCNSNSAMPSKNKLYKDLQVDPQADTELINLAFNYLADKYKNDTEKFEEISIAWSVLSDKKKRAEYDATGKWTEE